MPRHNRKRPGDRPGALREQSSEARIEWALYDEASLRTGESRDFASLPPLEAGRTLWLDVEGVPGQQGLSHLGDAHGLHRLALEDVQNGGQVPKADGFDGQLYLVLQLPVVAEDDVRFVQVNFFLLPGLVISIHEHPDLFDPVRARLQAGRGAMRGGGPDYLLYALMDLVVDCGFPVSDVFTERLESLEARADSGETDLSGDIYGVRRQLSALLRQAQRQRDAVRSILAPDQELISDDHLHFWRDCLDHAERVHEELHFLRESAADLLNTHLALISHRMNDVMKVLTIMSTLFVPLSFLVGLYGMNFDVDSPYNMPELGWRFGYFYVLGMMACVVAGVLWFFRRKRWI